MNSNRALAVLGVCAGLFACPLAWAQEQPAAKPAPAPATAPAPKSVAMPAGDVRDPAEPNVKHTIIEDEGSKIDELRVRGQAQRIVVTPKVGIKKSYEIITDSSGREMADGSGASRGAVGKRVWNVLNF
jgi:hypothetical protein